jgi:hypothetical protein
MPAKAVQYAAAYQFNHCGLWDTGSSAPVRNCTQGGRRRLNTPPQSCGAMPTRMTDAKQNYFNVIQAAGS